MDKDIPTYGMSVDREKARRLAVLADHYGVTIPELLNSIFNLGMDLMTEAMNKIPPVEPEDSWGKGIDSLGSPW